jgi:hypothetical protein
MNNQTRDVAVMWHAIDALDFTRLKAKMAQRRGDTLTTQAIDRAEADYRRFLKLCAKYPDAPIVPTEEVDEFWHLHILDTQRYGEDCEQIFGGMLHHDPYIGMVPGEDQARHRALADASQVLTAREFGEAGADAAYCVRPVAQEASAAYCVRAVPQEGAAAYCVRPVAPEASAAYCVRPVAQETSAAYCVRAVPQEGSAAYCVRAVPQEGAAAYCVRPVAQEASAAYCVRAVPQEASAAYCVRAVPQPASAAYCVRPVAQEASAAYCVRPVSRPAANAYCVVARQQ